jgi:peptidoglycan/xylan/chitin deacetylase (PgdA/CDA1 family)
MRYYKTPSTLQRVFSSFVWKIPQEKPTIYLTFDDGPIPELTPWVIEVLKEYKAKATFFCVGDNIQKHSAIFRNLIDEEHSIGNHTYSHLNAWKTDRKIYLQDIQDCQKEIEKRNGNTRFFRPPYGKLNFYLRTEIQKNYQIVLWDVLSYDFDEQLSRENCLKNVLKNTENGSIIVFHDNIKATRNLIYTLPRLIEHFGEKGFVFDKL